jgi:hypothetical protein
MQCAARRASTIDALAPREAVGEEPVILFDGRVAQPSMDAAGSPRAKSILLRFSHVFEDLLQPCQLFLFLKSFLL